MSDERPQSTEAVSLDEQVAFSDAHGDGRPRIDTADPITELRNHITRFIDGANLNTHHRAMASAKKEELIFWIRAGAGRG